MSRFNYRRLKPEEQRELMHRLAKVITDITDERSARFFIERLFTQSEIVMLMRRLQVAELLVGGLTYEQIQRKIGVGMSTIRAVDGWLTDAAYEYQLIREEKQEAARAQKRQKRIRARRHRETTLPGTLKHLIKHDSRMILLRILLGDL